MSHSMTFPSLTTAVSRYLMANRVAMVQLCHFHKVIINCSINGLALKAIGAHLHSCLPARFFCTLVLCNTSGSNLRELCSRCRQSGARDSLRRDSRNRWACRRRDWLGGNRPQQRHSSCQPCTMLNLGGRQDVFKNVWGNENYSFASYRDCSLLQLKYLYETSGNMLHFLFLA